jgi:hypothetical protein
LATQHQHATIAIKEITQLRQLIAIPAIRQTITILQIQITKRWPFQLCALNVIQPIQAGLRQPIPLMMLRIFQFIPDGTRGNGLYVQTVIPMHLIMHYLIAYIAILTHIPAVITQTHNVIAVIQEELQIKTNR